MKVAGIFFERQAERGEPKQWAGQELGTWLSAAWLAVFVGRFRRTAGSSLGCWSMALPCSS